MVIDKIMIVGDFNAQMGQDSTCCHGDGETFKGDSLFTAYYGSTMPFHQIT
jgi:hypothetical protein